MINSFLKNSLLLIRKERELLLDKIEELKKNPKISIKDRKKLERLKQELI